MPSEEEKRRVFDPRIEMDNEGSRSMRLNLGLAMSYQMLRRHGAQIRTDRLDGNGFSMSIVLKGAA